jgi:hypothetical protein
MCIQVRYLYHVEKAKEEGQKKRLVLPFCHLLARDVWMKEGIIIICWVMTAITDTKFKQWWQNNGRDMVWIWFFLDLESECELYALTPLGVEICVIPLLIKGGVG